MSYVKQALAQLLPRRLYRALMRPYHFLWAFGSAMRYGFPARKLTVIGITGTKGKSSVSEMLFAVLSAAGHKTALAGTIRFAIGDDSKPNLYKMTMPGHGRLQAFLAEAVAKGATHAVMEMTSEGAVQYRTSFMSMNALIFNNIAPEHIESHGSFEKYLDAKLSIGRSLARSGKRPRAIVANADNEYGSRFLALPVEERLPFSMHDTQEINLADSGVSFSYQNQRFSLSLPGEFSIMNALAVVKTAAWLGIPLPTIANGLAGLKRIPGRAERIEAGQDFTVVVDYAHTPDSLAALYDAYKSRRRICVLGNTGGGRDTWKRPEMGRIADESCAEVILTDEDPYDEDPRSIVDAMAAGMKRTPQIIMDRREAIHTALSLAQHGDAVLITGKGTDPYIMGPHESKTPWSDARVAREELEKLAR